MLQFQRNRFRYRRTGEWGMENFSEEEIKELLNEQTKLVAEIFAGGSQVEKGEQPFIGETLDGVPSSTKVYCAVCTRHFSDFRGRTFLVRQQVKARACGGQRSVRPVS